MKQKVSENIQCMGKRMKILFENEAGCYIMICMEGILKIC